MKSLIFIVIFFLTGLLTLAQDAVVELTFTARDFMFYAQLDSIRVMNKTRGGDTVLYWPDTVLALDYQTGFKDVELNGNEFMVCQNYPNPVRDQTVITLYIPGKDPVGIELSDQSGREILADERVLEPGVHSYRCQPGGSGVVYFTARWRDRSQTIKMLCICPGNGRPSFLKYIGAQSFEKDLKKGEIQGGFPFNLGDKLIMTGYEDTLKSGICSVPLVSQTYTFNFGVYVPCPDVFTVTYEGKVYNTIQILSQCWLKENLDVGTMIPGSQAPVNNGIIEKYCCNDDSLNCDLYGGLYSWDEMMQYATQEGARGICPPGWHVATDDDWKILEGTADSLFGYGDPIWDQSGNVRGYDAAYHLKYTSGWGGYEGDDWYGFSALPGGTRYYNPLFLYCGEMGVWWTSSSWGNYQKWDREIVPMYSSMRRWQEDKSFGHSVRCIKNE